MEAMQQTSTTPAADLGRQLDAHRAVLTAYCYRMLGSPFEAEDAAQETFLRAFGSFEGRAVIKTWLHRIATNVCLDMLRGREHRARPMDLGPASLPLDGARAGIHRLGPSGGDCRRFSMSCRYPRGASVGSEPSSCCGALCDWVNGSVGRTSR